MVLLTFALSLAQAQIDGKRFFYFEHPALASSWRHPAVVSFVGANPSVSTVNFPQCAFGLTSPDGLPMRKLTTVPSICSGLSEAGDAKS